MPVYCYQDRQGFIHERVFGVGKAPKEIRVRGNRPATRCFQAEHVGVPPKTGWPLECFGSGVNAEQAGELQSHLAGKGVPTEVTKDGNPVYKSASHRRKALKARGLVDKNSFI